ncbi:SRPBCC domain-containing protein [Wenxinia marina]|uniref:Activator of Hsp90 ATPase homologue 1/2-like C-terminal domain-containing protein n=1 Tax=Wenxinia marina DSM 24838 TaxID=1123501 RepID=A0A0D0P8L1_9RHOB|nr:SRPBCC domain-containing protein [Wenxinia marina]KIQ67906.1 hypothetical protein Wenmar_03637 [Wenxinia marina DSM 24838]GGL74188.1 vanillate O-demethylase oxidoreductase VanB [Wenxinia marina]
MQDAIVRTVTLPAPPERAFAAIADHAAFGTWFRARLDRPFRPGEVSRGVVIDDTGTEHPFWLRVEVLDPPRTFAFRWPMVGEPDPDDPDIAAKSTLVTFALDPTADGGTRLTITESGFSNLPPDQAPDMRARNEPGWDIQSRRVREYLGG